MHTDEVFFGRWTGKLMKNTTFLLFGRNSETKRYNVIGPTGVMVAMHWATNAPLTKYKKCREIPLGCKLPGKLRRHNKKYAQIIFELKLK